MIHQKLCWIAVVIALVFNSNYRMSWTLAAPTLLRDNGRDRLTSRRFSELSFLAHNTSNKRREKIVMMPRLKVLVMLSLATLCAPVFGANPARPGTLNYIEGSAYLEGKPLTQKAVGSTDLAPGQVLSTGQGKAEILLTPGVFLRLDDNSSVKMISPDLTFTQLGLERGRATVEVDELHPQNDLQIVEGGTVYRAIEDWPL